jgi:rhodanese-related sulfurtransferase
MKLLYLFVSFFFLFSCSSNAQINTISVDDFEKQISKKNVQLLDVRTVEEYQSGHLNNALQANWNNEAEFKYRVKSIDKNKPIYVYCLSGGRSNQAMKWLNENGYTTVYNLKGGINAWKQADKTVEGIETVEQINIETYLRSIPKDKIVLVDFGAEWCPPCRKMQPILDDLEKENYTIIKIDGGTQTDLCKTLNIGSFPTFLVYKNGIEIARKEGLQTIEDLKKFLNE